MYMARQDMEHDTRTAPVDWPSGENMTRPASLHGAPVLFDQPLVEFSVS